MRMTITRDFYRPKPDSGYKQYQPEIGDYPKDMFECWVNIEQPHNPKAMFFIGKQAHYNWNYRFSDIEEMKKKINSSISRLMRWEDIKKERKDNRKKEILDVKVGDLFCSSWGYEQTNVDFYQVIEVKGKTFKIRPIKGRSVDGSTYSHGMADKVVAVKDSFLEDLEKYPILTKRSFKLNSYSHLSKTTENEKHYRSWYA